MRHVLIGRQCGSGGLAFRDDRQVSSYSAALSASALIPAWRRIEARVPAASSLCRGTMTTAEPERSLQWLPRVLTTSKPSLPSTLSTSAPDTRGSADGLM